MPNMSLLMGDGTKSHTDYGYNSSFTDFPLIDTDTEGKFKAYGTNLALSLTYYLDSINTTVALGGRYQAIYTIYSSGEYSGTDESWEHTWGITLSAMAAVSFFEE